VPNGLGGLQELSDLPSTPPSDGVGAIPGSFSVTALGTPDYTIPIHVPPGRAGIQPALSLKYTGSRANGELGVGWTLDGLSSITRCPRVFAIDGYSAPIKNDPSDAFCIDGKRLIEVPQALTSGIAEYRTVIDSFAKIVAHMDEGPRIQLPQLPGHPPLLPETWGPDYFEVWTKDGRILTYGRSQDSLILARSGVRNSWLLTSVRDRSQNTMTIRYENRASQVAADSTVQFVRPSVIAYTGHGIGPGSTIGNREVRFAYASRVDDSLRYVQGAVGWLVDDRLEGITTFVDNVAVKSYWLDYKTDAPLSQIESIRECEGNARTRCKGATRFQYVEESGFTPGSYYAPISAAAQLDTNGDGIPDFLETIQFVDGKRANLEAKAVSISLSATMAILSFSGALGGPAGAAVSGAYMVLQPIVMGLLAHKPEIRYEQNMYLGTGIRSPRLETAIDVGQVRGIPCKPGSPLYFMDFDRDGKDDILGSCGGHLRLALSTGDGHFQQPSTALLPVPQYKAKPDVPRSKPGPGAPPIIYDIDGDSLQDVIICKNISTLELRRRNAPGSSSAFAAPVTVSAPSSSDDPFCGSAGPARATVDIDGDGTPDLIVRSDRGWKVLRYSLGSLVAPPNLEWKDVEFQDWNSSEKGNGLHFGDFNGDGLLDLFSTDHSLASLLGPVPIFPAPQTSPDRFNAVIWLNTGSGRFRQTRFTMPYFEDSIYSRTAVLDYDADGRSDVLESYHSPDRIPGGTWVSWFTSILSPTSTVNSLIPSFASDIRIPVGDPAVLRNAPIALAADLDGDGNTDLFTKDGAQALYGSGLRNTLLSRVEDGLGNFVTVNYSGTSERSGYEGACQNTTWPETCIPRLTSLVTSHSQGFVNAAGDDVTERSYEYKYRNARVSATGLGWIGFEQRTITESSPAAVATNDIRRVVTVDYEGILRTRLDGSPATDLSPPYVYPLADLAKWTTIEVPRESSPIEADPDGYMERTRISSRWKVGVSASNLSFPYLDSRSTTNYEYALSSPPEDPLDDGTFLASCHERFVPDNYGNIKEHVSECQNQVTFTTTTFAPNSGTWLISNPEFVTVATTGAAEPEVAQTWDPTYDGNGQLFSVTRSPARAAEERHTITYDRDEFGNPRTITESVPTGEADRVTTIEYDADNIYPMTVTNLLPTTNLSLVTRVDFDERWGVVKNTVDPNGVATQHTYDGLGRLRKTVDASGSTTHAYAVQRFHYATFTGDLDARTLVTTERKAANCPLLSSCADTITVQTELDHRGRPIRTVSPGLENGPDVVEERAYDTLGRLRGISMPHAARPVTSGPIIIGQSPYARIRYEYDNLDRVKRVMNSDSIGSSVMHAYASRVTLAPQFAHWLENLKCPANVIQFPWPPDGLPTPSPTSPESLVDIGCPTFIHHVTDEEQRQDVTVSNLRGQILRNIDGDNIDTTARYSSYYYDPFGRLTHAIPNRRTADTFQQVFFHERTYDAYGRVRSVRDPDGNTRTYGYNGFDEPRTSLDSKGQLRTLEYDDLGRLTKIIDSEEKITQWIYDQGVNALGRLSESISPGTAENPAGQRVVYTYEPKIAGNRGNLKQVNYVIDGIEHPVGFDYDNFGRMRRVHYPNRSSGMPVIAEYKYDRRSGALTGLDEVGSGPPRQMWRVTDTPFEGHLIQSETFGNGASTTYTYDPLRNFLTGIDTTLGSESIQSLEYSHYKNGRVRERTGAGVTQTYTYDALNRLESLDVGGTLTSYGYDTFGNLDQRGDTSIAFSPTKPYQLTSVATNSYFYDLNGNVRERSGPDIPGGIQKLEYTPFDLPHTVTNGEPGASQTTRFEYSADAQRLVQRDDDGTTRYFAGEFYQRTTDSTGEGIEERFRLSAGGRNIAEIVRASGTERTLFFHTDHLGSPDTITTDEGDVIHQEFDPFGSPLEPYDPELTRAGFTGHQHDQHLGLIDMRGRVYDPLAGRFLSTDAIIQAPSWSQGLNLYAYVFNDPVNATDPSGFVTEINGRAGPGLPFRDVDPRILGGVAAGLAVAGLTAYTIGMSPAASSITATAGPSATGMAGGAGHSLDIAINLIWDPFGAIPSSSTPIKVGANAMSSHPPTQGGMHAGELNKGLRTAGVEERPPELSLFNPALGALAQVQLPGASDAGLPCHYEECSEGLYLDIGPVISGARRAVQAVVDGVRAVWRWIKPPPPTVPRPPDAAQILSKTFRTGPTGAQKVLQELQAGTFKAPEGLTRAHLDWYEQIAKAVINGPKGDPLGVQQLRLQIIDKLRPLIK
jgi:RHS repeat-associated protein